jgi:hypothetical protein
VLHRTVVVLNLPKELPAAQLEAAEVVLAVRVVLCGKVGERRGLLERLRLHHVGKRIDARRHRDLAAGEASAEGVVEFADALSVFRAIALGRFSSCERAVMDFSVQLADIGSGCRRTGRRRCYLFYSADAIAVKLAKAD